MDWAQVLVVILAIFLAIFLLLAIALTAMLIKVTKQIRTVTSSAQRTAEHIEKTVAGVSGVVSPMFIIKILTKFMKKTHSKSKPKE